MKHEGLLKEIIHQVSLGLDKQIEAQAETMGELRDEMSPKEQMAAYKANMPQDWARLDDEKGPENAEEFRAEMLRREALSDANRRPV